MNQRTTETDTKLDLISMLEYRRPEGSRSERKFISRFILPTMAVPDKRGNYSIRIGSAPIMWSCHTDSVHRMGGMQVLKRVGDFGIGVSDGDKSNCLGADDAAGVWLMCEMIRAKVEGLYVFHRNEEHGCVGSRWLVKNTPELVKGIKFAVALDRRDKDDIITHQSGSRCCSDEFAKSLAEQLDMGYKPSPNGSFTDTAQYTGLIGECTNLSVGYKFAHSKTEEQDGLFLLNLKDKLVKVDVNKLVEKRKAGEVEARTYSYDGYEGYGCYGGGNYYGHSSSDRKSYHYGSYTDSDYPRCSDYGWWDCNRTFHPYNRWYGKERPTSYEDTTDTYYFRGGHKVTKVGEAMKDYELRNARKSWWEKLFAKSGSGGTVKYGQAVEKKTPWTQLAEKKPTTSVVKYKPRAGHNSKVRTIREELETTAAQDEYFFTDHDPWKRSIPTLTQLCRNHPEEVASYLEDYGVSADEISLYILSSGGILRC